MKSSKKTKWIKYFFPFMPLLMLGMVLFQKFALQIDIPIVMVYAFIWVTCWLLIVFLHAPFCMKSIHAREDGIYFTRKDQEVKIDYKNVNSVHTFELPIPILITLKYNESKRKEAQWITFMPEKGDPLISFITERIKKVKPDWENKKQTSLYQRFLSVIGFVIMIGLIYFLYELFKQGSF